jgi:hypothetical protein
MRRPCKFKVTDVTRAAKAVLRAGIEIARIEFKDGEIVFVTGKPAEGSSNGEASNPWDKVLTHAADKERPA